MPSNSSLFPDLETIRAIDDRLTARLSQKRAEASTRSASTDTPSQSWRSELASFSFDTAQDLEGLMDWTMLALDDGIVQMTHPGYLGLFNPAPTFPAECADRIASAYNPQICVWSHAPKAVEIEQHVIRSIALRVGMSEGATGHFTSGGAEANGTAVLCALTAKQPEYGEVGSSAFDGRPIIYASNESHLAWLKIAHAAGIGRSSVRLISTDGSGRMDVQALEREIRADVVAGNTPIMIAATAGTTNAGMVDPLNECAAIAERNNIWLHVDAAWGGALIACDQARTTLSGIEKADSVTIDAHKWFATTMGAGMFLTSRSKIPADVFRVTASYMPESEAENDFYLNSAQWSRRFLGLRLFLSLGAAGWDGYAQHVNHSRDLVSLISENLLAQGWSKANASDMAVACLVPPEGPDAVDAYVSRVQASGSYWVSKAIFEGRPVLRVCVTNGRTSASDAEGLIRLLTNVST